MASGIVPVPISRYVAFASSPTIRAGTENRSRHDPGTAPVCGGASRVADTR